MINQTYFKVFYLMNKLVSSGIVARAKQIFHPKGLNFLKSFHGAARSVLPICILLSLTPIGSSWANVGSFDDVDYVRKKDGTGEFILAPEWIVAMPWLKQFSDRLHTQYQKEFGFKLDESFSLTLTSHHNQVANAYATQIPFLQSVFYFGAGESIDEFCIRSWVADLMVHEIGHIYQLNAKRDLAHLGHMIFGNNPIGILPIPLPITPLTVVSVPYVTIPNAILPTWILEGNAVLNESRFGNGGRLYSGQGRALFYSLLQAGRLNEWRLSNNGLLFPFLTEKYIIGGYFNAYLAERFGIEKVNQLFWSHAVRFWNPLRINRTFKDHFGVSYSQLIKEFLEGHRKEASNFKLQTGEEEGRIIATAMQTSPLNRQWTLDGERIVFHGIGDGRHDPEIFILDLDGNLVQQKKTELMSGELFFVDGKVKTATTSMVKRRYIHAGIFDEDWMWDDRFDSTFLLDWNRQNQVAFFKLQEGFHSQILYKAQVTEQGLTEETKIGPSHSSALLDLEGRVYYFYQQGPWRVLRRDQEELFRFKGYYGAPMDIGAKGEIYFTANTPFGAGLFVWEQGKFHRLGQSDGIIHARKLNSGNFIYVELSANNYSYKVGPLSKRKEMPAEYQYFFEKHPDANLFADLIIDQVSNQSSAVVKENQSQNNLEDFDSYNMLSRMRFSSWQFLHTGNENNDGLFEASANFTDPMNYNQLELQYSQDESIKEKTASFQYWVTKWIWQYGFFGEYQFLRDSRALRPSQRVDSYTIEMPWRTNFYFGHDWNAYVTFSIGHNRFLDKSGPLFYQRLEAKTKDPAFLAFYPLRSLNLNAEAEQVDRSSKNTNSYATAIRGNCHFGSQSFSFFDSQFQKTNAPSMIIGEGLRQDESESIPYRSRRGVQSNLAEDIYSWRTGAMVRKVFDVNWQGTVWPIGVRRLSPGVFGHYFVTNAQEGKLVSSHFRQVGVSLTGELLLAHIYPLPIEVNVLEQTGWSRSVEAKQSDRLVSIQLKSSF